ncbi:hypothetical protein U9J35_15435 [Rossellomorea aquimaris]|nr:hypothetical protein [Rossellomorea aquimaris]WRP05304.1 hypothetical protein U9J35_15435 [Rossellomorea aquimaris]
MKTVKNSRKELIVNEIQLWKQANMLPEHYCDYLLALYTEGDGMEHSDQKNVKKKTMLKDFFVSICAIFISLFVIYFTELSIVLQTTILASFVGLLVGIGIYYTKKQFSPLLLYMTAACILLLASIEITEELFGGSSFGMYVTLFLNCFLWISAGLKWRMGYFSLSGLAGGVLLIIFILL